MTAASLQHRRIHNLLLISKLLNQRDAASPFTLVLDSLEQSGKPVMAEYIKRANAAKICIIFISFEALRKPRYVEVFVEAWKQNLQAWQKEVVSHLRSDPSQRKLLVFDSLNHLSATQSSNLPALLSSLSGPSSTLLALYHADVPLPVSHEAVNYAYSPSPLTLLRYLATSIFTVHSLHHVLAQKAARERSHAEPRFGLDEKIEGFLQGLGGNCAEGVVLEMEHRRKSGRGVREWYFLPLKPSALITTASQPGRSRETVILLEDHLQYNKSTKEAMGDARDEAQEAPSTFELGLTEKQRRDREGVVLPYFDAQKGGGEGGRILYDMGEEDDFDEEEDEI